jgi:hypothetical protein
VFLPEVSLAPAKVVAPAVKGGVVAAVVMEVMRTVTGLIWRISGAVLSDGTIASPVLLSSGSVITGFHFWCCFFSWVVRFLFRDFCYDGGMGFYRIAIFCFGLEWFGSFQL